MSSVLDASILVGKETTYGTAATLTRGFEGKADSWKREQNPLESVGFRAGMETLRSDRRVPINMGGDGELEFDLLNKGAGLLLQAALGSATGPVQQGVTDAYLQSFASTSGGPSASYTVQAQRADSTGTLRSFTHKGSVITGWSIAQAVDDFLKLKLTFDFQDVDTATAAGTPSYPDAAVPFNWSQCAVSIDGGSATNVSEMELTADLGMKTDRRFLQGSVLKKQPIRSAVPQFAGSLTTEFDSLDRYAEFVAGTIVPITFTWTGDVLDGAESFTFTITLAACQFDGESPEASLDDLTTQALPFRVLDNGTDPAVLIEYQSTDTAF
jgi:hypothetical protein